MLIQNDIIILHRPTEPIRSSETTVDFKRTTRRYISGDNTLHTHLRTTDYLTKTLHAFLFYSMRATCPVSIILLDLITIKCVARGKGSEASHYAFFSKLLLLVDNCSQIEIFTSVPCSQTHCLFNT
jgi:hypothetical protein